MMNTRKSDLIIENFGAETSESAAYAPPSVCERMGFTVHTAHTASGRYHTIITGRLWSSPTDDRRRCTRLCADVLKEYLRSAGVCLGAKILFAGIGNGNLASDSLGSRVCDRIIVTRGDDILTSLGFAEIAAVKPGISARTGIETSEQIALLASHMNADVILAVDALAARTSKRLQTVIQITDEGVAPGSAMSCGAVSICRETMDRPVISIGVPMVIRTVLPDSSPNDEPMLVTRAEADMITERYAEVIAGAVNLALSGNAEISRPQV